MTTETITWRKGDDPNDLARLCDRATEAKVEVTAVYMFDEGRVADAHRVTISAIPHQRHPTHRDVDERVVGVYVLVTCARSDRRGIAASFALESVTATLPPERPSWLPEGAEDGDWLIPNPGLLPYQWRDGKLWRTDGTEDPNASVGRRHWIIWPVWAKVKAERARLIELFRRIDNSAEGARLRAEVDRLSTVTDEMVEAAYLADLSTSESRGDIRRALEAALAVRDGSES